MEQLKSNCVAKSYITKNFIKFDNDEFLKILNDTFLRDIIKDNLKKFNEKKDISVNTHSNILKIKNQFCLN